MKYKRALQVLKKYAYENIKENGNDPEEMFLVFDAENTLSWFITKFEGFIDSELKKLEDLKEGDDE